MDIYDFIIVPLLMITGWGLIELGCSKKNMLLKYIGGLVLVVLGSLMTHKIDLVKVKYSEKVKNEAKNLQQTEKPTEKN